jgi:hypothetical protein
MTVDKIETGRADQDSPLPAFDSLLSAETQIGLLKISLDPTDRVSQSDNIS